MSVVDHLVSFDGIDWLWIGDEWLPEYYLEMVGNVVVSELCGC